MKYTLIGRYFTTPLFQSVVQEYFDTVLGTMIASDATLAAKGLFIVDGEVKRDYYDMPYHIHILNGLIPALFVYEQYLLVNNRIEHADTELYLRILMLGFTFHDANKLLGTKQTKEMSELEVAVRKLDTCIHVWEVNRFFPEFELHKSTIYYLALATENRTNVAAEDYPITTPSKSEIRDTQRELCHLADGLASIQNEQLESIENLYQAVQKSLSKITKIADLPISYVKVRQNPYTLLSQNLLQITRKELDRSGKKVLFATREGFIFWGEDVTEEEFEGIKDAAIKGSQDNIDYLTQTLISPQKCEFNFIGSIPFTQEILREIVVEKQNDLLKLPTNNASKIYNFEVFKAFLNSLIISCDAPIEIKVKDDRIYLEYAESLETEEEYFQRLFNLYRIQWLSKSVRKWEADFLDWKISNKEFGFTIQFSDNEIANTTEILDFLTEIFQRKGDVTKNSKLILCFIKAYLTLQNTLDIKKEISNLEIEIIDQFQPKTDPISAQKIILDRYFYCCGKEDLTFLDNYSPSIPIKKEMCVYTGGNQDMNYNDGIAFGLKATGFSNRTVTTLNNTKDANGITSIFAEENRIRRKYYPTTIPKRGENPYNIYAAYFDFFEVSLGVDRDIIKSCLKEKNEIKVLKDGVIEFDKNSKFQFNLFKLEIIKIQPNIKAIFFLVRKCLRMCKLLGLRSYIAGIMTPYTPHKAIFHFENAPKFLKALGWNTVRVGDIDSVLDEMNLALTFGPKRIEGNLLKIAGSRMVYFKLYYHLKDKEKKKVSNGLYSFYSKYKNKHFTNMTAIEELADLAVELMDATRGEKPITRNSSGANQTWLIRSSTDILRRYVKQGKDPDFIIQIICGEINRKLTVTNSDAIEAFASAIYHKLFIGIWNGQLPPKNIEKEFIYSFAYLFAIKSEEHHQKSKEKIRLNYAKKLKQDLEAEGMEINEANIKSILSSKAQKYASQYLEIIQSL
ncbi:MAG: hypothetical protein AAF587_13230 [Bacteroidota bacterium]